MDGWMDGRTYRERDIYIYKSEKQKPISLLPNFLQAGFFKSLAPADSNQ